MRCVCKIIFLFCLILFCDPSYAEMLIIADDAGKILHRQSISPECGFAVSYTHSVALTPVTDFFTVHDDAIWLEKTEYQDFGAGLPHAPQDRQKMSLSGGKLIIENYKKKISPFFIRVGRVAKHTLLIFAPASNGQCRIVKEIPLSAFIKPGYALRFDAGE